MEAKFFRTRLTNPKSSSSQNTHHVGFTIKDDGEDGDFMPISHHLYMTSYLLNTIPQQSCLSTIKPN